MFTCKQVSKALSEEDYAKMTPMRRFFLKLHVRLCVFCGRFNTQVIESQDMCSCFKAHEEELAGQRAKMPENQRDRLKAVLAEEAGRRSD